MRKREIETFLRPEEAGNTGERININLPIRRRGDGSEWPRRTPQCPDTQGAVGAQSHVWSYHGSNPQDKLTCKVVRGAFANFILRMC